jgi:hypothetical protein
MAPDPKPGDARTKKQVDVLASEEECKMGCAECCDCWCHCAFTNRDGSDRDDAEAMRAEMRRLNLESRVILEMRKNRRLK